MNKYSSLRLSLKLDTSSDDYFRSLSELNISLSKGGLSPLTANENIEKNRSSLLLSPSEPSLKLPKLPLNALPSTQDFLTLINKLDIITSRKDLLNKDIILLENEQLDLNIEENSYAYIKIPTKNKKNPLKVTIKRKIGKIISYVSSSIQKPCVSYYDNAFTQDSFEIRCLESFFRVDFIYIGIRALISSKISILTLFGKFRNHYIDEKKIKKKGLEVSEETTHLPRKVKKNIGKTLIPNINFQKRHLSPEEIQKKQWEWICRREKVLQKRKLTLKDKKEKALEFLNKQKIRSEKNEEEKKLLYEKNLKILFSKELIALIYLLKSAMIFRNTRNEQRKTITKKLTINNKARKIQRFYRSASNILESTFKRSLNLLLFFHSTSYGMLCKQEGKKILDFIKTNASFKLPKIKFNYFVKSVQKIQQEYRKYKSKKAKRINHLIELWENCKTFQTKKRSKRNKYEKISYMEITNILEGHYLSCVHEFYENLRSLQKGTFLTKSNDSEKPRIYLKFEYVPSNATLKKMIETAEKVKGRSPTNIN